MMSAEKETFVFLAGVSALLEFYSTFKDKATRAEKHTLNMCCDKLRRVEKQFERQGLTDDPYYDKMVEILVEAYGDLLDRVVEEE